MSPSSDLLNRRQVLGRSAAGLTALFCFGRLEFDSERVEESPADDLHLAAAATLEFLIQNLLIPYGIAGRMPVITDELKAANYEISKLLKPSNAPFLFAGARVSARGSDVVVQFSETVSLALSRRTVTQLRRFMAVHPGMSAGFEVRKATDPVVVWALLKPLSRESAWIDD